MKVLQRGAIALVFCLYLYGLGAMGLFGPDETRYAYIGRGMAQSGDWVMPRLYGVPWFEKPALLYWLIAMGNLVGLGPEWAPRLPVALLGLGFLAFFWSRVRLLWGGDVAGYATAMLGTSAGWLAYSHAAVTDIPLSVSFGAAILLGVEWLEDRQPRLLLWIAACLGFSVLAKGVVGPALFLPIIALSWRRWADWLRPGPLLVFLVIVLPWYVACEWQSGGEFLRVFIGEHTFGRVTSPALQHVQHWWYYLPVTVVLIFPWFSFLPLVRVQSRKTAALATIVVFGVFLFSISLNKLPGYVLPLLPSLSILLGEAVTKSDRWKIPLIVTAGLCGLLPIATAVLPIALSRGLRATEIPWISALWAVAGLITGVLIVRLPRAVAFTTLVIIIALSFVVVEVIAFPLIDRAASARVIWLERHPNCYGRMNRGIIYGLQYYAGRTLPECTLLDQSNPRVVR